MWNVFQIEIAWAAAIAFFIHWFTTHWNVSMNYDCFSLVFMAICFEIAKFTQNHAENVHVAANFFWSDYFPM